MKLTIVGATGGIRGQLLEQAIGAGHEVKAVVAEQGTLAIVRAMDVAGTRRLVVVSAAPISTVPSPGRPHPPRRDPGEGLFMRNLGTPLFKTLLRERYTDLAL